MTVPTAQNPAEFMLDVVLAEEDSEDGSKDKATDTKNLGVSPNGAHPSKRSLADKFAASKECTLQNEIIQKLTVATKSTLQHSVPKKSYFLHKTNVLLSRTWKNTIRDSNVMVRPNVLTAPVLISVTSCAHLCELLCSHIRELPHDSLFAPVLRG